MFSIKTALRSSVHTVKINVKLIKIRVFSEKNPPKMSRDVSGKSPEIPRKKSAFFFRFFLCTTKRYSPFLQNSRAKISGKIVHFSEENFRENSRNPGKFWKFRKISGKKVSKMTILGKFDPRLQSAFYNAHF
jgi:hypothetical protein